MIRTSLRSAAFLLALHCAGPEPTPGPGDPAPEALAILTTALPPGQLGTLYQAWLQVEHAEAPAVWTLDGELPEGLVFNPAGAISGTPDDAGSWPLIATVSDAAGSSAQIELILQIDPPEAIELACGGGATGSLTASGLGSFGPDLDVEGGTAWVAVSPPGPEITRLELDVVGNVLLQLLPPGDSPYDPELSLGSRYYTGLRLDAVSQNQLEEYQDLDEPLWVLLIGLGPTDWSLAASCTDGPLFEQTQLPPTRVGEPLALDYELHGDPEGAQIYTEDPLPAWVTLDEETGQLSGTAAEVGVWEYNVIATTPDGRQRVEPSGFGVYDVAALPCGVLEQPLTTEEGMYEGTLTYTSDPRGWALGETALQPGTSSVQITVSGLSDGYASVPDPWLPEWSAFNSIEAYATTAVTLEVSPRSWPPIASFQELGGTVHTHLFEYDWASDARVSIDCSTEPRPDLAALPVLQPGTPDAWQLPTRGGVPPMSWAASGLPDGVTLTPDGRLLHDGTATAGSVDVELTVTDAADESRTEPYPMWIGDASACLGARQLTCGDTHEGRVPSSVFQDFASAMAPLCLSSEVSAAESASLILTSAEDFEGWILLGHPGAHGDYMMFIEDQTLYLDYTPPAESTTHTLDDGSIPSLDHYRDMPISVLLMAYEAGDYTFSVDCG